MFPEIPDPPDQSVTERLLDLFPRSIRTCPNNQENKSTFTRLFGNRRTSDFVELIGVEHAQRIGSRQALSFFRETRLSSGSVQ